MRLPKDVGTALIADGVMSKAQMKDLEAQGITVWSNKMYPATWKAVKRRRPDAPFLDMRSLYGTLEGKTAFLVGSGPSLNSCPEKLPGVTIAINRAIERVKADYWAFIDAVAWNLCSQHPNAIAAKKLINAGLNVTKALENEPAYLLETAGEPLRWKVKEDRPIYWNESTFSTALHLLVRMGAKRIVCVGCDFSIDRYFDGYEPKGFEGLKTNAVLYVSRARMRDMFGPDKPQWYEREVEILDASDGALPVPKVKLEDVL